MNILYAQYIGVGCEDGTQILLKEGSTVEMGFDQSEAFISNYCLV